MKDDKPFHESIVDAIGEASSTDLHCLGRLIKATAIPKGHDQILTAWEGHARPILGSMDLGVPEALRLKKRRAERGDG
jgi:hypothetical protein